MQFSRLRRLRRTAPIRDLVSETRLQPKDFIMPYFIIEGRNKREEIKSMPGIFRLTIDNLIKDVKETRDLGIKAVLFFGVSSKKNETGSEAYSKIGIIQGAIREIKGKIRDIIIITDVCLCGYTSHGHCGIVKSQPPLQGRRLGKLHHGGVKFIDNDETIKCLAKIALSHAEAGADFVAPSAMMDGQVGAIREGLDEADFKDVGILAYSAKYASSLYGPFREALDSAPQFGDRKSYQMDYRNSDEALREIGQDMDEGADMIMVKPALAYLDVIYRAKEKFNIPVAAYNVSGEYAMVKSYCRTTEVEKKLTLEILTGIKRAGADLIITYHAKEAARWLR